MSTMLNTVFNISVVPFVLGYIALLINPDHRHNKLFMNILKSSMLIIVGVILIYEKI
jgi:hypothetical protein